MTKSAPKKHGANNASNMKKFQEPKIIAAVKTPRPYAIQTRSAPREASDRKKPLTNPAMNSSN